MDTLLARLTATRAGYLDNLSGGAVALEATLTAIKGAGWTNETLKAIKDVIDALNDVSAADVWTYPTRTLTSPVFGDIVTKNLAEILADEIAFNGADIDVAISSRASAVALALHDADIKALIGALNDLSAAEVWAYTTRNLTAQAFPFTNPASPVDVSNIRTAAYTLLTDVTYGLSALNTDLDSLLSRLTATRAGYLDNLSGGAVALASVCTEARLAELEAVPYILVDTTSLLSRLTAARAGYLDNLSAGAVATQASLNRKFTCMTWWSDIDDNIDLPATAADTNLPPVVVSGIPSGATLVMAVVVLKVRSIENSSSSGPNAIKGAQNIRVMKSTGSWGTDDVIAINLTDNMWTVAASTREMGDVLVGDNDVKSEVDGNATYNLRFEDAIVDYQYLRLWDVQVGIRIWFY